MDYAATELYETVKRYVEAQGGTALVLGGIEVIKYSDDWKYNYRLAVRITGIPPKPSEVRDES